MSNTFVELVESQLNEISRNLASSYIAGAKNDERKDRSAGVKLAQKKKWGDAKFGFEEPKVKATSEEVVSEAYTRADHWMAVANHALHNATSYPYDTEEHHKWMTVHHKAMSIHGAETNNHEAEHSHSLMSERHADMAGGDEEFHNGESHHWSRF